jgi:hypothetical protein
MFFFQVSNGERVVVLFPVDQEAIAGWAEIDIGRAITIVKRDVVMGEARWSGGKEFFLTIILLMLTSPKWYFEC